MQHTADCLSLRWPQLPRRGSDFEQEEVWCWLTEREKKCFSESHLWGKRRRTGECQRLIDRGGTEKRVHLRWGWVEFSPPSVQGPPGCSDSALPQKKKKHSLSLVFFSLPAFQPLMFCFLFFFPPPHTTALAADAFPEKKSSGSMLSPPSRKRIRNMKKIQNNQKKKNKMKVLRRLCSAILWEVIIVEWHKPILEWNTGCEG